MKAIFQTGYGTPDVYELQETAEAFRYLNESHAKGKVVIVVNAD